jgi:hypothetical protein
MAHLRFAAALLGAVMFAPAPVAAHCDAADGPVASAAIKALESKNVHLILPYAPARAGRQIVSAFEEAVTVRNLSAQARVLVDRYFVETAVRLHREGEGAAYTGLKPAGTDFGPAIPAAEHALQTKQIRPLIKLLSDAVEHGIGERFEHTLAKLDLNKEPANHSDVQAARERVSAELEFIGYAESIYLALKGGSHAESYEAKHTGPGTHRE